MMTSSNGNISALLAICAGNSPVPGEFPTQRPVTRSFGVFFDLRLNKRLSKQWWGWWLETLSRPLWRHRNVPANTLVPNSDRPSAGTLLTAGLHIFSKLLFWGLTLVSNTFSGRLWDTNIWISDRFLSIGSLGTNSVKFYSKFNNFHSRKLAWFKRCRLQYVGHFVSVSVC